MSASELNPGGGGAAELVASVNDLMVKILVRVPAKSVTRLKLVSKEFCSLISGQEFVQSHAQVNNYPSGMFRYTYNENDFFWLSETKTNQPPPALTFLDGVFGDGFKVRIMESCSGLLLCRYWYDYTSWSWADGLLICNPTTKTYRKLPMPDSVFAGSGWFGSIFHFAFDLSVSPYYKLVCVAYNKLGYPRKIEVYSSNLHRWRPLGELKELNIMHGGNIERYSNWKLIYLNSEIFHFDLKSEALVRLGTIIQYPEKDFPFNYSVRLQMISQLSHHVEDNISVVEMSHDFRERVTMYRVNLCELTSVYPEIVGKITIFLSYEEEPYNFHSLGLVNGLYSKEEPELVLAIPGKIISYNFVKKTVKTLHNLPHLKITKYGKYRSTAYQFIESLSPV